MNPINPLLPFSAVVGQDDAKLALLLGASEPRLGGVLLRGHKGSAKTTLARGLAGLLTETSPFVELPLGATEDRVLGSIDAAHLLTTGETRVHPGLLAAAHGGVLYVDEVNLLADHLVDALLDTAVSGIGRIERDGISHTYPARFVLVASMNPEEGELRPQLLDRFGLAADIIAPDDPARRVEAVTRQLDLERASDPPGGIADADAELARRLAAEPAAVTPAAVIELACQVALEVGAEGLRADLMLSRAAAAAAAWDGRAEATEEDLRRVSPLVLGHRRRRNPFDEPGITADELDAAFDRATQHHAREPLATGSTDPDPGNSDPHHPDPGDSGPTNSDPSNPRATDSQSTATEPPPTDHTHPNPEAASDVPAIPRPRAARAHATGRGASAPDTRGRFVRAVPAGERAEHLAVVPSARAVATKRAVDPQAAIDRHDLYVAQHQGTTASLVILAVDTSSSMGAARRVAATRAAVLGLLTDAYQQRDRVALVAFGGRGAEVSLRPTGSVEVARSRLAELPIGGTTPLGEALDTVADLGEHSGRARGLEPVVVVVTDGRATAGGDDPLAEAQAAAARLATLRAPTLIIDAEDGPTRLGLAAELAGWLGATCVPLNGLDENGHQLTRSIRALTQNGNSR